MRHKIPSFIHTTAVLSVLVLIGLHLPLQAEPPKIAHGQLQVEADPFAQTSALPRISTLWAALWEQLIPSAAAADITITDNSPDLFYDDTNDGDNFDWQLTGLNQSGTVNDIWFLNDSTDGLLTTPLRIQGGDNNDDSLVVDALGDLGLANSAVFIDRDVGHLNIGSTTETCCELFVTGDSVPEIGLRSTGGGASTWKLGAGNGAFRIAENTGFTIFGIANGAPITSLFIQNTGHIGLGTFFPADKLHVLDGNLRIEQDNADNHALLNFVANGTTWEIKQNKDTNRLTFFSPGGGAITSPFKFDRQATENLFRVGVLGASTVDINGDLVVTGTISNPDYVFTPEYALESIDDHAAYMWEHHHLPAVGAGQVNAQGKPMVNVATRSQGMLEELEKAHIYIEQLHKDMVGNKAENETELKQAHQNIEHLQGEVTTLKKKETELEALKSEMTALKEKVSEMETLKTMMHQLLARHQDVPSKG